VSDVAIIGGTGLAQLPGLEIKRREVVHTPFGEPSGPLTHGVLAGREAVFLARHGYGHTIPPHRINYRANLWALESAGVKRVVAVAVVGGISDEMTPGSLVIPDQIIDYTWGRPGTFVDVFEEAVLHIDFTEPYDESLRRALIAAAGDAGVDVVPHGTYAATQGPRLESAAEVRRLEADGCDIVGMTGMPEAALARELGLAYACCAVVANHAAGKGDVTIHEEIESSLPNGMERAGLLLTAVLPGL
jgi:5'-methylthioinosine phosphorylase